MNKWLLLDCHYLCYRAFHTTGQLSFNDVKTGVIYGFLRDIASLQDLHGTDRVVFCFDSKQSRRQKIYPPYKAARRQRFEEMEEEELAVWQEMRNQIVQLRRDYLPALGFKNILCQRGYEADDMIASVVFNTLPQNGDEGVIVASDHDLFQLLGPLVTMWNPNQKKATTAQSFRSEWGIGPERWAEVKAFAGCSSDGVEGIAGVGEKTAAKWIQGKVNPKHKVHDKVLGGMDIFKRNLQLVRLPFEGTKEYELVDDEVTKESWERVTEELGMNSIRDKAPIGSRRKGTRNRGKGFGL